LKEFNRNFLSDPACLEREDIMIKIGKLSAIYRANYASYMQLCWDGDRKLIDRTCKYIDGLFHDKDVIGEWESLTGMELLSDSYQLIIVPSLRFGPRANSLHYGVNIFPAITEDCPKEYFDHFISHEVGTHILAPCTIDIAQISEGELRVYYIAFENLAKHLNLKLLADNPDYELGEEYYEDSVFKSMYSELESEYGDDICCMYTKAIDQYQKKRKQ